MKGGMNQYFVKMRGSKMKIKYINFLVTIFIGVAFLLPSANAATITLDGKANAGWYDQNLSESYLNIFYDNDQKWTYNGSNLLWENYEAMILDLSDDYIGDKNSGGTYLGEYTINSGGDVFSSSPNTPIYKSIFLTAGNYNISLADYSETYNRKGYSGEDAWTDYVQIFGGNINVAFGDGGITYSTENEAYQVYSSLIIPINITESTELKFYLNDWNSLDNIGKVTLDIQPVPEPATLLLLGSGMAAIATRRKFRRKENHK
jgi:hypothetical protein